jgi:glycosyltransferase involved in cell wall biosynthesis
MSARVRVLLLCEYATLNGGEQSMLATLPTLLAAGFEIVVALPADGPLVEELHARGIRCVPFALFDSAGERLSLPLARQQLAERIAEVRPALLHANSLAMGRLAGPVARELGLASISHLRDILGISATARADLNCHSLLLAVSNATRDYHVAAGLDPAKMQVLYNGVDLQRFAPAAPSGYLQRELGLLGDTPLIGSIGQLGLRKDPLTFLQAAQHVALAFPAVHFLIVGERNSHKQESIELENVLHQMASTTPLAGRVHFLGVRSDIARLLPELTLLVHTARQEPLGRVLLEAAASGTAIAATAVGGTIEIFPPETHSAQLFAPGDVSALSAAMQAVLASDTRRQTLGINARHRAEAQFDIRQRAVELVGIYRSVMTRDLEV